MFLSSYAGRSVEPSSPASLTGQDDSYDADEDEVGSLISALLAADRTRYEAEHMKLALHVDSALHFPAAVEALLSRHIAELEDERAWVEALLDSIFERDEEDERQVCIVGRRVRRTLGKVAPTVFEAEELHCCIPPSPEKTDFDSKRNRLLNLGLS